MIQSLLLATIAAASPAPCDVTLTNANVWTGTSYEQRTITVQSGKFTSAPSLANAVDASRLYLTPPFADAHNHRIDTPDDGSHGRALAQGIFYALNPNNVRPAGPTRTGQPGLVDLQASGGGLTRPGGHPQPVYEGLARDGILGPMTVEDLPGKAFHPVATPAEARAAVARVKANGASVIKLYLADHDKAGGGDGLSAENFAAAVDEARKLGLHPLVHVESAADFRRAVAAKIHAIVHLPYVIDKGRDTAELMLTPADAAAAAANNVYVVPTAAIAHMIYDGERLAAMQAIQRHNLTLLRAAGVKMGLGADRWTLNIHDEIGVIRGFALFEGAEVINMATTHGAHIAFPGRKIGAIAPDHEASFVAWFRPLNRAWSEAREPVVAMREGQVMFDTIGLFAKACAKP